MKIIRWLNRIFYVVLPIYAIYVVCYRVINQVPDRVYVSLAIFPCLIVPWVIKKVLKYEMTEYLTFIYFLFILISVVLGSIEYLYASIWWFDLLAHGISGVLSALVAIILLRHFHLLEKKRTLFIPLFMISFVIAIAGFWEMYEFTTDSITGEDTQWVEVTGVDDTMTDMLIAFAGGILTTGAFMLAWNQNEKKVKKCIDTYL